jgi:hypothetical protein
MKIKTRDIYILCVSFHELNLPSTCKLGRGTAQIPCRVRCEGKSTVWRRRVSLQVNEKSDNRRARRGSNQSGDPLRLDGGYHPGHPCRR